MLQRPLELIKTSQFKKYNVIFWLSIAALTYVQDLTAFAIKKGHIYPGYSAIYLSGWLVWMVLTPMVVKVAVKTRSISRHLLLAVGTALVIELAETILIVSFTYLFFNEQPPVDMLSSYLIYTFHTRLIIYFLIVAATSALEYFGKVQHFELQASMLQSRLMEAKLKALKMQIQPHFLFNAHHAIVGLMLKKNIDKAVEMLTLLSDLLRKTLEVSEEQLISLREELQTVSLYLRIEQVRFNDRLKITVTAEPPLMDAQVPPFILQPLVENAVKHGFAPHASSGHVSVSAEKDGDRLVLMVSDDGCGLCNGSAEKKGIGVENVQSRLKELFGNDYHFLIFNNEGSKGVTARIEIPYINEKHGT